MPLYYSTSAPTSDDKNSITRTATNYGIRDFLLNKNIINPIKYPQLPTSTNGSPRGGEPFLDTMVGDGSIQIQPYLEDIGIPRYLNAVQMNMYKDDTQPEYVDIEDITKTINANFQNSTAPNNGPYSNIYQSDNINRYGLLAKSNDGGFRKRNTIKNLYLDSTKQVDVADLITLQPLDISQQINGYIDQYGYLNFGSNDGLTNSVGSQTANVIGSFLNGQGVNVSSNGQLVPNFDFRGSLAGRVLTATGFANDTKLGQIGGQQLLLAMTNNAASNIQKEALGALNIKQNITSLLKGDGLDGFRSNYKITITDDFLGKVLNVFERVSGFDIPKSDLDDAGSIFSSENGNIGNIQRANQMLRNTGRGQRNALADQFKASLAGTSKNDSPDKSPFRSGYSPRYEASNQRFLVKGQTPKLYAFSDNDGYVYNFIDTLSGDTIPKISYEREKMTEGYGFNDFGDSYGGTQSHIIEKSFSWTSSDGKVVNGIEDDIDALSINRNDIDKKTLLGKTQKLFNSKGMKNIVSSHGDMTIKNGSQIQTSVVNGGISKGSAVLAGSNFNPDGTKIQPKNDENLPNNKLAGITFCRAWTTYDRYDSINKLIRNSSLNKQTIDDPGVPTEVDILTVGENNWRYNILGSVLQDNGMPKITPQYSINKKGKKEMLDEGTTNTGNVKKYMFSIENLAWCNNIRELIEDEIGPGDLLTGKKGRIMWFPPYDISFSETSSVQNEATSFIGRGEPIYTYNNTERTGNLSFKIIVDHPSILNSFTADGKGPDDEFIRSWWAGCTDLDPLWGKKLTVAEQYEERLIPQPPIIETKKKAEVPNIIRIFFQNDITKINLNYENGDNNGIGSYVGEPQKRTPNGQEEAGDEWPDKTDFGLNTFAGLLKVYYQKDAFTKPLIPGYNDKDFKSYFDPVYKEALKLYLKDNCPKCKAIVNGAASKQGNTYSNGLLAQKRAEEISNWLINDVGLDQSRVTINLNETASKANTENPNYPYVAGTPVDEKGPKVSRYAYVSFENMADDECVEIPQPSLTERKFVNASEVFRNRVYNESKFFKKLEKEDSFVFDKIRDQIKYFHPSFHSMTPEGFNSRLTFLLQCTRQGPSPQGTTVKNLAFGPQPVCILRIGDFYNTKIYIDNVQFDFEPLVWDLNPEGIGVQPMIANVTISFKYIGGSTLLGPINKLQNALSFNFFANTQVYDKRSDTIIEGSDKTKSAFDLLLGKAQITEKERESETTITTASGVDNKQVQAADKQNNDAANTTPSQATDLDNLVVSKITSFSSANPFEGVELSNMTGTRISATISLKNQNQKLTKDYNVINVKITNVNNPNEKYTAIGNFSELVSQTCIDSGNVLVNDICRVPIKNANIGGGYDVTVSTTATTVGKVNGIEVADIEYPYPAIQPALVGTGLTVGQTYKFDYEIEGLGTLSETRTIGSAAPPAPAPAPVTQSAGKPKVTGIEVVEQTNFVTNNNSNTLTFKVRIKTENIFSFNGNTPTPLISEQELATFVYNGIKIVLTSSDGTTFNLEELVTSDSDTKGIISAVSTGFEMGDDSFNGGFRIKSINDGTYSLSVFCAGEKIQTIPVQIGKTKENKWTFPYKLSDTYTATGKITNKCDELHAFQGTKKGDKSFDIGNMNVKVRDVLYKIYDDGINPDITDVEVIVNGCTVTWTVTIEESKDGNAWVGFTSRGSADSLAIAKTNFSTLQSSLDSAFPQDAQLGITINEVKTINKSGTGDCAACEFWQIFGKYNLLATKPSHYQ